MCRVLRCLCGVARECDERKVWKGKHSGSERECPATERKRCVKMSQCVVVTGQNLCRQV